MLFTHKPEKGKEKDYEQLNYNIDPTVKDSKIEPSYVRKEYGIDPSNAFDPPDKEYRIHKDDMPIVKKV